MISKRVNIIIFSNGLRATIISQATTDALLDSLTASGGQMKMIYKSISTSY